MTISTKSFVWSEISLTLYRKELSFNQEIVNYKLKRISSKPIMLKPNP